MASLGDVFVNVVADTSGLQDSLESGLRAAVARTALGSVLGSTIAAGVAVAIKEFLPLEQKLLEIFQVGGVAVTDELFSALSDNVTDIALKIGKPAEEVGASIALGIGRGFNLEASEEIASMAGRLSVALNQDMGDSTKAITATVNGFGLAMEDTERATAILFQTASRSGVPIGQLAQQIGNIAPLASGANVSLEDTSAALATMLQQGVSSAEATTQLRTAINELSQSGTDGGKVFKSISGKTFPQFIKEGGTLQQALALVADASNKSGYSVQELTGNINTVGAVTALTGENTARYTQNLIDNKNAVSEFGKATETVEQGAMRQFQVATEGVRTNVQKVGESLRPVVDIMLQRLTPAIDWVGMKIGELAAWLSTIDWSQFEGKLDSMIATLANFGDLFMAIAGVLSAINWNEIFAIIVIRATPVIVMFKLVAEAVGLMAAAIEWATPVLRPIVDVLSYVAVGVTAVYVAMGVFRNIVLLGRLAILAYRAALVVLGPVLRATAALFRLLMSAATPAPLRVLILVIASLSAAFVYAWRNSEKFREIVVNTFNTVKNAVLSAVQAIVRTWVSMAKALLNVVDSMLAGWSKLPKILGGGIASDARGAVQAVINGLDAIERKVIEVTEAAQAMNWTLGDMVMGRGVDPSSNGGTFAEIYARQQAAASDKKLYDAFQKNTSGGGGAGPSANTSGLGEILDPKKAAKEAKSNAAAVAKRMRDLLKGLYDDIAKFAKTLSTASLDQVANGFDSIIEKFGNAITDAADAGQKKIVERLKKSLKAFKAYEKQVTKLVKKREGIEERLKTARDELQKLKDEAKSFGETAFKAFNDLGKVSEGSAGIGVTFLGIRNNLRDAIRTTQQFSKAFKQLQQLGLNETSLRQLAEAGPAALDQALSLARSGQGGINEINRLQAQLDKDATKVSSLLTNEFYKMGINAGESFVKGLESQEAKIVKAIEKIAKSMTNSAKKTLKIASPSKVFDEIGRQVPAGMAAGVRRGSPDVAKAIAAMSSQRGATVNMGGIQISGVSDPAAARRAGILAGDAIQQTLAQRRSAQILSGVA